MPLNHPPSPLFISHSAVKHYLRFQFRFPNDDRNSVHTKKYLTFVGCFSWHKKDVEMLWRFWLAVEKKQPVLHASYTTINYCLTMRQPWLHAVIASVQLVSRGEWYRTVILLFVALQNYCRSEENWYSRTIRSVPDQCLSAKASIYGVLFPWMS